MPKESPNNQIPPQGQASGGQSTGGQPPNGQNPKSPTTSQEPPKKPVEQPKKDKPKAKKDESLKYDLTYANGGFNDGVEIKPGKNGSIEMKISLYGGGEQKVMKIKPLPKNIATLIQAYEVGANNNDTSTPEITQELQSYFLKIKEKVSFDIIRFMQELDDKIEASIQKAMKGN